MEDTKIANITENLKNLPPDKLQSVYDFVNYLVERDRRRIIRESNPEVYETMLASEDVLRRDWDKPEEDEAWADL